MFACVHVAGLEQQCLEGNLKKSLKEDLGVNLDSSLKGLNANGSYLEELVVLARGFSPLVEETSADTVVLDLTGCERLFGSPRQIGREIARQASRSELLSGVSVAGVSVAANPDVAVCAAIGLPGVNFISPGREAAALAD